ncbi:MAG: PEGA domain-containing protein [Candidatus Aenigmarchaeota archaeon]|nr:PEGA domain-containing protein [Candidatus Aenigmarchaeota archaeon]
MSYWRYFVIFFLLGIVLNITTVHASIFDNFFFGSIIDLLKLTGYAVAPTDTVSYYKFDESSGTTASDSSGANTGTLIGGPSWTAGRVNNALNFDGINDHVSIPDSSALDIATSMTITAWIKASDCSGRKEIVQKNSAYGLKLENCKLVGYFWGSSEPASASTLQANTWYHIAYTYDGTSRKYYINGQLDSSHSTTGSIPASNLNLWIARGWSGAYFNGIIDEVKIYNRALSATEITDEYNSAPTLPDYDAQFISQSVPSSLCTSQKSTVNITMKNTGNNTWTSSDNIRLGSQNPQDNTVWGTHRVFLNNTDSIKTNEQKTFTFEMTSPSTAGTYNSQWKMLKELVKWFGENSTNVAIAVQQCPSQQPDLIITDIIFTPLSPTATDTVTINITVKNTGIATTSASNLSVTGAGTSWSLTTNILPSDSNQTLQITTSLSSGTHTFTARADADNVITESNETNNELTKTLTVSPSTTQTGNLSTASTPTNANVYVNNTYRGTTPINISLSAGIYAVNLTKSGYLNYTTTVTIAAGETRNLIAALTPSGTAEPLTDTSPPVRSNGSPTGMITVNTSTLSLTTNELSICRYSTAAGASYNSMTSPTALNTTHSWQLSNLPDGEKNYYIRCNDTAGNANTDDYRITFTVNTSTQLTVAPALSSTDLLDIALQLETLKTKFSQLKDSTLALVDYYDSTGDTQNKNKFTEIVGMLGTVINEVTDISQKINRNVDNPDAIKDELKDDVQDLKEFNKEIVRRITTSPSVASAETSPPLANVETSQQKPDLIVEDISFVQTRTIGNWRQVNVTLKIKNIGNTDFQTIFLNSFYIEYTPIGHSGSEYGSRKVLVNHNGESIPVSGVMEVQLGTIWLESSIERVRFLINSGYPNVPRGEESNYENNAYVLETQFNPNEFILGIISDPPTAKIYINNTYKGTTPSNIVQSFRPYSIEVTKMGYENYTESFQEATDVSIRLISKYEEYCPYGFVAGCQTPNVLKLFGQKSIKETSTLKTTANGIFHASGVVVDKNSTPNKVYVFDTGNNRILGFNGIGYCTNDRSKSCTIDSDCGSSSCYINGTKPADMVIGQSDFESGACNRDNNFGINKAPAADTLCLIGYPYITNLGEYWMRANFDVDGQGNLYLVDVWNNRVLKYNQPFSSDKSNGKGDAIADYVWGQDDFNSNGINRGTSGYYNYASTPRPDDSSLWTSFGFRTSDHVSARGVSFDSKGNLWVADTFNHRILRFQPNSKQADLVLGQPDFTSNINGCHLGQYGNETIIAPLDRMCTPTLARFDPGSGELYVLDEHSRGFRARILVFKPPFTNGMSAYKVIAPEYENAPGYNRQFINSEGQFVFSATGFIFNTYKQGDYATGRLWVNLYGTARTVLIDDNGNITKVIGTPGKYYVGGERVSPSACSSNSPFASSNVWTPDGGTLDLWTPGGSIGIDSANNIYLADETPHRIMRYALPYEPYKINDITCLPSPNGGLFPATRPPGPHMNVPSNESFGSGVGLAVFENQLIIQDAGFKVFNDYLNKPIGASPDIIVSSASTSRELISDAIDDSNRLWAFDVQGKIRVYQLPFQVGSENRPLVDSVRLYWEDTGNEINYHLLDNAIAFDKINKKIYVVDGPHHRILRVSNYNDLFDNNPNNNKLFVDMVIGQPDKEHVGCNYDQLGAHFASDVRVPPTASSLCKPHQVKFDKLGNLYVVENNYECQGNDRITVFMADDLKNAQGLFPNLQAKKAFVGGLTSIGPCAPGTIGGPGSPVSIAFNSKNQMVVGNDGYYGDSQTRHVRQLWFYADPLNRQIPDDYIPLPLGAAGEIAFDSQDNLIVQDHTWSKVWIINLEKDPLWLKNNVTIFIDSDARFTSSRYVTPTLSCSGITDCSEVQFSNDGITYSTPEAYATTKSWTLSSGDGTKTVYAKFKDSAGNLMSVPVVDTITLDTIPPERSNAQPTGTIASLPPLAVTTNENATCRYSTTAGTAYNSMTSDTTSSGTFHSWSLSRLTDDVYNYYVKCRDRAGNVNTDDYVITFTLATAQAGSLRISIVSAGGDTMGADIYVDNVWKGFGTGQTTTLPAGQYKVKITKESYVDYIETVNVVAGQTTTVRAVLVPGIDQTITLAQGWKLIGLNVSKPSSYTAEDFLRELDSSFTASQQCTSQNKVAQIVRWDSSRGRYVTHYIGSDANNFPIALGEGYFIKGNCAGTATITGEPNSLSSITISRERSMISLPTVPSSISTAEDLLQSMQSQGIDVREITQWFGGSYRVHYIDSDANNFPIQSGEGYFIRNYGDAKTFLIPTPVRSNGQPTGTITTTSPTFSLTTDESTTCRYSTTSGASYNSMTQMSTTGGTSHSQSLSELSNDVHNYYIKCRDSSGNTNTDDYTISFTVDIHKRVFITSIAYNGNMGGLDGGDQKCQSLAGTANLGGEWKAWLSNGTISASSRLTHSNDNYKLLTGTKVADDWSDLTDGSLDAAINVDQSGNTQANKNVWTATGYNGERGTSGIQCENWSNGAGTVLGLVGNSDNTNLDWTQKTARSCSQTSHLYCFEQ